MATFAPVSLICCAFCALCYLFCNVKGDLISLKPGEPTKTVIPPHGQSTITVGNISSEYSHITFQAHTHRYNVSISSSPTFVKDLTLDGSHVGIVTLLSNGDVEAKAYLKSDLNYSLSVLIHAELYTPKDPVPGACNQVFKLENDPNIHLTFHSQWTQVKFQWSNLGIPRDGRPLNCEIQQYQSLLRYDLFVLYSLDQTEETCLSDVSKMLSARDVMKNGRKVISITNSGSSKSIDGIAAAKGQGVLYAIVVTDTTNNTMATYIPAQTYSCGLGDEGCERKFSAMDITIAVFSGILGLFLCFLGHRFLKTEFFVFGFLGFSIVFYVVMRRETEMSIEASFGVSVVVGVVGGLLCLLFWYYKGVPVISVLFVGLTAGYLVSSLLFYTPFGNVSYWESEMTYGLTFTCGVLIAPVFLLCFTKTLNIVSCTFVGSYLCVLCVDIFLWGGMKYILLNSFYKQSVQDYLSVTVIFPFRVKEVILSLVWGLLFFLGSLCQFWRERKKAPFPPCPAHVERRKRLEGLSFRQNDSGERRPLLAEGSRPEYSGQGQGQIEPSYRQQRANPTAPVEHNQPT